MSSDAQRNQGSPAKPGVDNHDPQNRDPNGIMDHVKVSLGVTLHSKVTRQAVRFDLIRSQSAKNLFQTIEKSFLRSTFLFHLFQIKFEDLIAEPDTEIYSFDKIWATSQKVRFLQ